MEKSCGNCVNCDKYIVDGKEKWACENAFGQVGMPVNVYPPYDGACANWSNNPNDEGKAETELRNFIDHFWDEE